MPLSAPGFKRIVSTISDLPDLLTIDEVCDFLEISKKTGYQLLKDGKIQNLKVGRSYRIPKQHLMAYLGIRAAENKE